MNTETCYQKAIDLLLSNTIDYKKIVVELAKFYPETFVKLATSSFNEPWHSKVKNYILAGEKVSAVKLTREKLNLGLKEALDVVHLVQNELRSNGHSIDYYDFKPEIKVSTTFQNIVSSIANS